MTRGLQRALLFRSCFTADLFCFDLCLNAVIRRNDLDIQTRAYQTARVMSYSCIPMLTRRLLHAHAHFFFLDWQLPHYW